MRSTIPEKLEAGRIRDRHFGSPSGEFYGAFHVMGPRGAVLHIIASDGVDPVSAGWEHVSVSLHGRPPNWAEMCFVKDLFWNPEDCVVQFHPPRSEYVNCHPHCLHLWRHRTLPFPAPPSILVGPKMESLS